MQPDVQTVLKIQELDQEIRRRKAEIASLPKHIAAIERQLDSHKRRLEADRAAVAANQRDRKKLETDVKDQQARVSKLRGQMMGSSNNEQYRAFQHEIEFCEKEIQKADDQILELMEASEALEANVHSAEAALAEERKSVDKEKEAARSRTVVDEKRLAECRKQRTEAVAKVPVNLVRAYERLLKKHKNGKAVAEVRDGACMGCMLVLRPQFFQEIKQDLELKFCESCGRFLFYDPPKDVEREVGSASSGPMPIRRM